MHHVVGIDPGYSLRHPTTGFAVLALEDDGRIVAVKERGHCLANELLNSILPRILERFSPRLAAIDAPLMGRFSETSPFGATKCRPQELVSMQKAFTSCGLKAGHAFTPRGLDLHKAGQAVADSLTARGFAFDPFDRIGELCTAARSGGSPVVVEAFPKFWLGLQLPPADLTSTKFPKVSHDRDAAMLRELLRDEGFIERFGIDGCSNEFRIVGNADELAAITSALSGVAALHGCRSATGMNAPAVAMGSPQGGHFILPPRTAWHPDHAMPIENAVRRAATHGGFDSCAILELR